MPEPDALCGHQRVHEQLLQLPMVAVVGHAGGLTMPAGLHAHDVAGLTWPPGYLVSDPGRVQMPGGLKL